MYPSTKFQSFCRTSNYGTKYAQKNMTDKKFEKINIKIVISISECIPAPNFSLFGELQVSKSNLPKKY